MSQRLGRLALASAAALLVAQLSAAVVVGSHGVPDDYYHRHKGEALTIRQPGPPSEQEVETTLRHQIERTLGIPGAAS